jgi:hypothetical protein
VAAALEGTRFTEEEFRRGVDTSLEDVFTVDAVCTEADSVIFVEITTPRESTAGGSPVPTVVAIVFVAGTGVPVPGSSSAAVP